MRRIPAIGIIMTLMVCNAASSSSILTKAVAELIDSFGNEASSPSAVVRESSPQSPNAASKLAKISTAPMEVYAQNNAPVRLPSVTLYLAPNTLPLALTSKEPLRAPTNFPVPSPSMQPHHAPTKLPFPSPSQLPIPAPTEIPSMHPHPAPTKLPFPSPSQLPNPAPTEIPSLLPSALPAPAPSELPIPSPSAIPTKLPSPSSPTLSIVQMSATKVLFLALGLAIVLCVCICKCMATKKRANIEDRKPSVREVRSHYVAMDGHAGEAREQQTAVGFFPVSSQRVEDSYQDSMMPGPEQTMTTTWSLMAYLFGASSGHDSTKSPQVPSKNPSSRPFQSRESDISALTEDYEHEYEFAYDEQAGGGGENRRMSFRHHRVDEPGSASIESLAKEKGVLPQKKQSGKGVRVVRRSEQFAPGGMFKTPSSFLPSLAPIEDTRGSGASAAERQKRNEIEDVAPESVDYVPKYSF